MVRVRLFNGCGPKRKYQTYCNPASRSAFDISGTTMRMAPLSDLSTVIPGDCDDARAGQQSVAIGEA